MDRCTVCGSGPLQRGVLCGSCAVGLDTCEGLCAEQVRSAADDDSDWALIDAWGRMHGLPARSVLGRGQDGDTVDIAVAEGSVSRHHAELRLSSAATWTVRDLRSTNGTFVDGSRIDERNAVEPGTRLRFGDVSFYLARAGDPVAAPSFSETRRTGGASSEGESGGLATVSLTLIEPSGGGGGVARVDGVDVQLSQNQLELLGSLMQRMNEDRSSPSLVRGYLRSSELLGMISWDTAHPAEAHLKQLVRRTRKALEAAGAGDLIEGRQRFGYRLSRVPSNS